MQLPTAGLQLHVVGHIPQKGVIEDIAGLTQRRPDGGLLGRCDPILQGDVSSASMRASTGTSKTRPSTEAAWMTSFTGTGQLIETRYEHGTDVRRQDWRLLPGLHDPFARGVRFKEILLLQIAQDLFSEEGIALCAFTDKPG